MIGLRTGSVVVRFGLRSLVFLCFSALFLVACGGESAGPEQQREIENTQQQDQTEAFNEKEFFQNPDDFEGRQVTVSGRVTEVIRPRAFRFSGEDVDAAPLLVVSTQETNVATGQVVRVTGTVRRFDVEAFIRDLRDLGVDFNAPEFREFAGRPVMVAESVTVSEGTDPDVIRETGTATEKSTTATP